ncbi:hypothetical protein QF031_002116 [Pseudarthrobacter defluvii]|uniref:hypothetical protein n=1 Tax=Pseudarthrobacter defluvii TaxID=410837 RepID=UPI002785D972|nr:hypothetical protein [Pseudarthrobacter defluvii]MDQ0769367.1 hypothetical protein [Pseudarthrobacter defluvii]
MASATVPEPPVGTTADMLFRRAQEAERNNDPAGESLYLQACHEAVQSGRIDVLAAAVLQLINRHRFGTAAGQLPALLNTAYRSTIGPAERSRLGAAMARLWVYSGEAARAADFAADALHLAEEANDPDRVAEALEAGLLVHWGPQEVAERAWLSARLAELTAYTDDVELRLRALCWVLTSCLERLDGLGVQRQLRELELLAVQSGSRRVSFYALSRRAMYLLLCGETVQAAALCTEAAAAGRDTGDVDTIALEHTLRGEIARQTRDKAQLAAEAGLHEEFARAEGVPSVLAQAAVLWLESGDPQRARLMARQIAGKDFGTVQRDVDWLLTACLVTDVATRTGDTATASLMADLLEPFAGQGVVNAGSVSFHGMVDAYLGTAALLLGNDLQSEHHLDQARAGYGRLGATWWEAQLPPAPLGPAAGPAGPATTRAESTIDFRPTDHRIWKIGPPSAPHFLPHTRGFEYLRQLIRNPGKEISCLDLATGFSRSADAHADAGGGGEILDDAARTAYKQRLANLASEIEDAESWNDTARASAARQQRQVLIDHLAKTYGLMGRPREFSSAPERARVAVRKAITAAIDSIATADPATATLLRSGVHTGRFCRYEPDPDRSIHWQTEP